MNFDAFVSFTRSILGTVATIIADNCRELGRNYVHVPIDVIKHV